MNISYSPIYARLSILGAALVLLFSAQGMERAAIIQVAFQLIALGLFLISFSKTANSWVAYS
ncbi:hypothetical protein GPUN_0703 [Glaciecola punicea ACAM 611]|uniref:Uncharacterized protein n=1 Tax=Glaciecola punicea ACAM 611 TaxID=1121923 RepID=H5T965_9ALTE|nr:hypothetical protein BAE46_08445 [Glaciecola punicea]GAB54842.1 hypothetical protein GPUN_0703 [Glaciecola punicea ACAM 611]